MSLSKTIISLFRISEQNRRDQCVQALRDQANYYAWKRLQIQQEIERLMAEAILSLPS